MAGYVIVPNPEFLRDCEESAPNVQLADRLSPKQRGEVYRNVDRYNYGAPVDWEALAAWPVQCACGVTVLFATGWYETRLACPQCLAYWWSAGFYEVMKGAGSLRFTTIAKWVVALAPGPRISVIGEQDVALVRGASRFCTNLELANIGRDLRSRRLYRSAHGR